MSWKNKRILITGITGFVGSHLGNHLAKEGATVYGLCRKDPDNRLTKTRREINGKIKIIEGDILNPNSLELAINESEPEFIFHLAGQSFVPTSVEDPKNTYMVNSVGTLNILESTRLMKLDSRFVFAGTSEEYGMVFASQEQYTEFQSRFGNVFPEPSQFPELPIKESNPLRPMSPYAVAKVSGDYMTRNYAMNWGLHAMVSRAFNHEGSGRGKMFVTSIIAKQVTSIINGIDDSIIIGNVNSFRDWSHVSDIVSGYCIIAQNGRPGEVYNQGSERTSSILSYILTALHKSGMEIYRIESLQNNKIVDHPMQITKTPIWNCNFEKTKVDYLMLTEGLSFDLSDQGIRVITSSGTVSILFDSSRYRPLEVPILLSDTSRLKQIGFRPEKTIDYIISEQLNKFNHPKGGTHL